MTERRTDSRENLHSRADSIEEPASCSTRPPELRRLLSDRFELDDDQASEVLQALIGAIHDRLGRGLQTCLISWIPETWPFLRGQAGDRAAVARGEAQITQRLEDAGLPPELAPSLVETVLDFLESRCGRPLGEAVRRRVPELERMAVSGGRGEVSSAARRAPATSTQPGGPA